ncbi:tellurite resistance protein TehB [Pseudomonas sp. BAY1663]|uniref:class I SAM-dependent methyltransferase n=1 Tax=Pseudomonas sp. BAY1663 TaxID=1439940 RepID=UPI00042DFE62|nr:class I SAM-dependent methyltransferase [Pseudomonas sp. BAY1663]EXF45836.1 tellurite resistance protein TehB [Pseudomonas sp. BAY1663]
MSNHLSKPWSIYDQHSDHFFQTYNKIYFSSVHRPFIKFLPKQAAVRVLDIGCGSGRDARALAKRGYTVTAVDPSTEMLRLAEARDVEKRIIWKRDALPQLLSLGNTSFSFILLSAVWMHIHPQQRDSSIKRISELLDDDGHLAITLRIGNQDKNRMIYTVTLEELLTLSSKYDLHPIYIGRSTKDSFNRSEISWKKVVLKKSKKP